MRFLLRSLLRVAAVAVALAMPQWTSIVMAAGPVAVEQFNRAVTSAPNSALAVRAAPAPGSAPAASGAAPTVAQVTPTELTNGQAYTLSLNGSNLHSGMRVDFGAGVTVQGAVAVSDAGHAQVSIQVASSAPSGHHTITVTYAPLGALAALPTLKTQGPGFIDVNAPAAAAGGVVLNLVTPRQVTQGQQAVLSLHGLGFSPGIGVSFGPGITASGPVNVSSATEATVTIQVAAQAPLFLRHPTLLAAGRTVRVSPEATVTVMAGSVAGGPPVPVPQPAPAAGANLPVILAVSPARLFTGEQYTLTLRGINLVPQLKIDLGSGITLRSGLRVQSPSLALVDVSVDANASTGLRWLALDVGSAFVALREDASVLVQRSAEIPRQGFGPAPSECKPAQVSRSGHVVLDGPLYTGQFSDVGGTFNVPVLNDQTTLIWHEANIGLADRYEVRFYAGSTLIATRALTASPGGSLPHSLTPDDGLIAELTSKLGARATKIVNEHPAPGTAAPAVGWDLTWQVVGLHAYYDSCLSPAAVQGTGGRLIERQALGLAKELVVETSEAVPIKQPQTGDPLLDLPTAPTGLSCAAPRAVPRLRGSPAPSPLPWQDPTLTLQNASRASQSGVVIIGISARPGSAPISGNGRTATADYVGDQWQFGGKLDLSGAPWAMQSQQSVSDQPKNPVESESLNNVFVDWGDGTVEPLTVQWNGQYCGGQPCFASNTETSNAAVFDLSAASNPGAFGHAYGEVGSFNVRVYMLPAGSLQQHGAQQVSLSAGGGGLFGRLLSHAAPSSGDSGNAALAYMPFCQTVIIQHRTDPAASGPLQLHALRITGFPGTDSTGTARPVLLRSPRAAATAAPAAGSAPIKKPQVNAATGFLRPGAAGAAAVPQFSSCDADLVGGAQLDFVGQGTARLTWYVDGKEVGSSDEVIGPSTARTDAQLIPGHESDPIVTTWHGLRSPSLSLAMAQMGQHALSVTAQVIEDAHPVGGALENLGRISRLTAAGAGASTLPAGGARSPGPPLGVLGPRSAVAAGLPAIQWIDQAPAGAPGLSLHAVSGIRAVHTGATSANDPPNSVASVPAPYQITAADPALPCTFKFPVKGGSFLIAGLQHGGKATVQVQNGIISGSGTLQTQFADASGTSTQPEPFGIQLKGWTMQADGVTVAKGSFDEQPAAGPMHVPGLTAQVERLTGTAGDHVTATLTATLVNTDINTTGSGAPPSPWKGVAATLSPQGDWYADQLPLPALALYDSGFVVNTASVALDLSQVDGSGADPHCQGGSGPKWMGVLLQQPRVTAFNFDLPNPPAANAPGWALDSYGFCGNVTFPSGSARIVSGSIGWASISALASQGSFTATYTGLKVHVPWLNTDLTSPSATTELTAGRNAGQGGINLNLTTPAKVTLTEGPITLTASNLRFASVPAAGGWAVKSDTTLNFAGAQGAFAEGIVLHDLDYAMSGAAAFGDGSSARHLSLAGQKGAIGGSLVDLKSVDVQVPADSSTTRLAFAFDTTLNLSKTLPAADVAVSYSITEPAAGSYIGAGPVTAPFKLDKPFPDANPSIHLSMTPKFVGNAQGGARASSGVLFSSNLDLSMFGGPPVSGQFVLGYVGSDDYWLAKAVLDLGPTGVVIAPPVPLNLYQIGGGMGYNVTLDSFKNTDLTQATPQDDGTLLFDATLLLGSTDHATFGLLGDFVIKPGGQDPGGRMDYHAWLLDPNWSGNSPITGHFSFSGGVFDGTLNAQFSVLNNQIGLDASNDAIHMHIGGGQWYFHFGTEPNPLNGHVFAYNGQAWADLGSDGFGLGLKSRLDASIGDCGGACAYIHDDWLLQASITPSPLAFAASAGENFNLGACADGFCISANASASVSLGLPPPQLSFSFGLGGCPPGQINVGLEVLPSPGANVSGNACL